MYATVLYGSCDVGSWFQILLQVKTLLTLFMLLATLAIMRNMFILDIPQHILPSLSLLQRSHPRSVFFNDPFRPFSKRGDYWHCLDTPLCQLQSDIYSQMVPCCSFVLNRFWFHFLVFVSVLVGVLVLIGISFSAVFWSRNIFIGRWTFSQQILSWWHNVCFKPQNSFSCWSFSLKKLN